MLLSEYMGTKYAFINDWLYLLINILYLTMISGATSQIRIHMNADLHKTSQSCIDEKERLQDSNWPVQPNVFIAMLVLLIQANELQAKERAGYAADPEVCSFSALYTAVGTTRSFVFLDLNFKWHLVYHGSVKRMIDEHDCSLLFLCSLKGSCYLT